MQGERLLGPAEDPRAAGDLDLVALLQDDLALRAQAVDGRAVLAPEVTDGVSTVRRADLGVVPGRVLAGDDDLAVGPAADDERRFAQRVAGPGPRATDLDEAVAHGRDILPPLLPP